MNLFYSPTHVIQSIQSGCSSKKNVAASSLVGRRTNITANGSQHKVKPPTTTAIMVVILTQSNCSHLNVHLSRIKEN